MTVDEILQSATAKAPAERAEYLDRVCENDSSLRALVEGLIASLDKAGSFLEQPLFAQAATAHAPLLSEPLGTVIGPYKLMEQIGEGGMGLVYVAEQHHPVRRKVALKLIKPGMDTRQVIARFEAERQALALMDHPNIARVIDGGATASGRPYFVMELVRGVPITEYCDEQRLTPRARLELFRQVCAAVQHAHQKGIIHRDIKPSNVLVVSHDGTPVVKVIDFGVAKAIAQQLTDKTLYTQFAQFIGTPLYMSPEQAGQSGLDVDTRTDVYALGVLLYELLTGATPFDRDRLRDADYGEIRRIIREEEPPRPSTRMSTLDQQAGSTLSAQRQSSPRELSTLLRGELDWIVMKSLEKDRNRRYESPNSLAADVDRYLQDEPVLACPPSRGYRLGKFLRKHRTGVVVTTVVLAAIAVVGAGTVWVAMDRVTRWAGIEQAVAEDLREVEMLRGNERWDKMNEVLERATVRLAGTEPEPLHAQVEERRREVTLVTRLQDAQLAASAPLTDGHRDYAGADKEYTALFSEFGVEVSGSAAHAAADRIRGVPIRLQLVTALDYWAFAKDKLGKDGAPLRLIADLADDDKWRHELREASAANDRKTLERLAATNGVLDQPPVTLLLLSHFLGRAKADSTQVTLLRQAQERYPADFWMNFQLGCVLPPAKAADDSSKSERVACFRVAVALRPRSPMVYVALATALQQQMNYKAAEAANRKAIALKPDYSEAYFSLCDSLQPQNRGPETVEACRKGIALNPENARGHLSLGHLLMQYGNRSAEAETSYREAIKLDPGYSAAYLGLANTLGAQHRGPESLEAARKAIALNPGDATAHFFLGNGLAEHEKNYAEAEKEFREAIKLNPDYAAVYHSLGTVLSEQRRYSDAEKAYRDGIKVHAEDSSSTAAVYAALGVILIEQHKFREAEEAFEKAVEFNPTDTQNGPFVYRTRGNVLFKQQRLAEAEAAFKKAVDLNPRGAGGYLNLGYLLETELKFAEAEAAQRKAIELEPKLLQAYEALGGVLVDQDRLSDAEQAYLKAIELDPNSGPTYIDLGACLATQGKLPKAEAAFRKAIQLDPVDATAHFRLAITFLEQGRFVEALDSCKRARRLEVGEAIASSEPPSGLRRDIDQFIVLDPKLPKMLTGETVPMDAAECAAVAELCQFRGRQLYAASVRFYIQAFAADPEPGDVYGAAQAAVRAGAGEGKDAARLTPQECAALRKQALAWLRIDLAARNAELAKAPDRPVELLNKMRNWYREPSFASVRGEAALARLPEEERQEWQKLWQDVATLVRRAAESK